MNYTEYLFPLHLPRTFPTLAPSIGRAHSELKEKEPNGREYKQRSDKSVFRRVNLAAAETV